MEYREELIENEDFFQMYLEDVKGIVPCTGAERELLLTKAGRGDAAAKKRLVEGHLRAALETAGEYVNRGLPAGDLVQEANMALLLAVEKFQEGDFLSFADGEIRRAVEAALEGQKREAQAGEEAAARANVLQEVSKVMAEELGREATLEELAERMKMTKGEVRDIMKMTMDAISILGNGVESV